MELLRNKLLLAILTLIVMLNLNCGGGGGGDGDGNGDLNDTTPPTIVSIDSMALVLDTSGTPIANATIPEDIFTDQKGVARRSELSIPSVERSC
jgi:hypothetical protein